MRPIILIDEIELASIDARTKALETAVANEETLNAQTNTLLASIQSTLAPLLVILENGLQTWLAIKQAVTDFANWSVIGFAIKVLTLVVNVQQGWMLCSNFINIAVTTIENVIGLVNKDWQGKTFDINSVISGGIKNLLTTILGSSDEAVLEQNWNNYNRIYQSGANLLMVFQTIQFSVMNAMNVIGQWSGEIGNALKRFGLVGVHGFDWRPTNVNFHGSWTNLQKATMIVNSIQQIAGAVQQGQNGVNQMQTELTNFQNAYNDPTQQAAPVPQYAPVATAQNLASNNSHYPAVSTPNSTQQATDWYNQIMSGDFTNLTQQDPSVTGPKTS